MPLLERFAKGTPHLSRRHWHRLFHYSWEPPDETRGFIIFDGDRPVGFEAFIQHQRVIDGEKRHIVNGSSWVVLPEYRRASMMIRNAWAEREATGTVTTLAMSTRLELHPLFIAYGFKTLETHQLCLAPLRGDRARGWKVTSDPARFEGILGDEDLKIFRDHRDLPCRHLLAWRDADYCYVVSARRAGPKRLGTSMLFHISHPENFMAAQQPLHAGLLKQNRAFWVTADERLFRGVEPRGAKRVPLRTPRMYHSMTLEPGQIDNLYTELILLEI